MSAAQPIQERCSECRTPNACADLCLEQYIKRRITQTAEECAKLVEDYNTHGDNTQGWQEIFANAIRAKFGVKP